jgi:hypothetical protein
MTRYGFSLIESEGAVLDHISVLLDNGSRLKTVPVTDLSPELFEIMTKFSEIDGVQGRTIFPLPHALLTALKAIQTYDHLTMQDRLDQISSSFDNNEDMRQILDDYLSMNTQDDLAKSGWLDHLCFWTLRDYDTIRMWDKTSRYKINEGTSALAQAMFNDCQDVNLLLSTPVVSIHRTDYKPVTIQTQSRQLLIAHAAIITVPLNALHNLEFQSAVEPEKQYSITEGQCRSGTKFWMKLENSVGN